MQQERLEKYFFEADKHIDMITEALDTLEQNLPIKDYCKLSKLENFALNTLIFRFSKLQDLLGTKIFRNYLDYSGYETSEKSFFELLKEIEKESIVDIDTWNEFRVIRNNIAHEYPHEEDEINENINLLIQKASTLIEITNTIKSKYHETASKRN